MLGYEHKDIKNIILPLFKVKGTRETTMLHGIFLSVSARFSTDDNPHEFSQTSLLLIC